MTPKERAIRQAKLKSGDWQFGHAGRHHGPGAEDCPGWLHHHHDFLCPLPTVAELHEAGIDPATFTATSRA